jgi:hypothetical protein
MGLVGLVNRVQPAPPNISYMEDNVMPIRLRIILRIVSEEGPMHIDHLVKRFRGKNRPRTRIEQDVKTLQGKGRLHYKRKDEILIPIKKATTVATV